MGTTTSGFAAIVEVFGVIADGWRRAFRDLSEDMQRGLKAQADQRRRELDDELDWLGDYRGRRG